MRVDLSRTSNRDYRPGRSSGVRILWLLVEALIFLNPLFMPFYGFKRWTLRRFGAEVGEGVLVKPAVHIKYPWRLSLGDHVWIGERAWIDNMEDVKIGPHSVISQGAYLCTGNHDWSDPGMPLNPQPIVIHGGVWVGAYAKVGPGVTLGSESILTIGAVCVKTTMPGSIYAGNPAELVGSRRIRE